MRRLTSEDGTIVILVAAVLVVVMGFAAIAIDVGALYEERRQLQNGADGAAMAAAWDCAEGLVPCAITGLEINNTIDEYANANARDSESAADIVELNLTDQYITVETSTVSNGNSFLRNWFAGVLGNETSTVRARAKAAWGKAGGATTVPLTFSYCEWIGFVGSPPVLPSPTVVIEFHTPSDTSDDCVGPAGTDTPGGFGWLDDQTTDGTCSADVTSGQYVDGTTGNFAPHSHNPDCTKAFFSSLVGQTILIPIFSAVSGTGAGAQYYIEGFAAFVFEGYRFPGGYTTTPPPCAPSTSCISGRFVDYVSYADYIDPSAGDYGVTVVALQG